MTINITQIRDRFRDLSSLGRFGVVLLVTMLCSVSVAYIKEATPSHVTSLVDKSQTNIISRLFIRISLNIIYVFIIYIL